VRVKETSQRAALLVIWLAAGLFLGSNMVLAALFQDRVYPGIKLADIDLGGMTRREAHEVLTAKAKSYHLSLVVDNVRHNVKPADIGAGYDVELTVNQAFSIGRSNPVPIFGMIQAHGRPPLALAYTINRQAMADFASKFVGRQASAPVDASIVVKDGVPRVIPAKDGLGVNRAALIAALEQSLGEQTEVLNIQRAPVAAEIPTEAATKVVEKIKLLIATQISLSLNDKTFQPTPALVGGWLVFTKTDNGTLVAGVDSKQIDSYLTTVAKQVEVAPVTKKISVVNGQVKGEEGGSDGTAINREALAAQIAAAVIAGQSLKVSIPMVVVPFKTQYNRTISLDAPKYIEINLSSQRLWAYQDHQVAYESAVTSGATGLGFPTVTGLFSIYTKQTNRYLDGRPLGYNYNVFVQYWMPFHADYGLHDASWRNGIFGGQDYYYNGSHGCVNLPTATAAWLYNWAPVGTPVWVHI
jgi:lipoprotein-anchoring transpeptidase ErfK/SrfK